LITTVIKVTAAQARPRRTAAADKTAGFIAQLWAA
jgi:hypothetical protein